MTVRFIVRQITSDGHGLVLDGELQGGVLEAGDHLAFDGAEARRPHLHVRRVEVPPASSPTRVTLLVDAPSSALIDAHTVLTRVVPGGRGGLLPLTGMPTVVEHADLDEPDPVPIPLHPDEPGGSGTGYDAFK